MMAYPGGVALRRGTRIACRGAIDGGHPMKRSSVRAIAEKALREVTTAFNRFIPWHKLPLPLGLLNLIQIRRTLRAENLHDTSQMGRHGVCSCPEGGGPTAGTPAVNAPAKADPSVLTSRTADGTFNDLRDPKMGSVGTRFGRNVPLPNAYPTEAELLTPNPRVISRELLTRRAFKPATSLNLLAAAWVQFMTDDWFSHGPNDPEGPVEIPLSSDDPWPEHPMKVRRTGADPTRCPHAAGPPTFVNHSTHWWDASQLYGSDLATQKLLRSGEDGKLKLSPNGRLLTDTHTGLGLIGSASRGVWVGLTTLHLLFTLEHNAICDRLQAEYPSWSDDELFARARLVNAALLAKIHTLDWTTAILAHPTTVRALRTNWWGLQTERVNKAIGRITKNEEIGGIPGSPQDHHGVPYSITEEFVAVYRMHPLMPDHFIFRSMRGGRILVERDLPDVMGPQAIALMDTIPLPDLLYSMGIAHPGALRLHNYPRFMQSFPLPDGNLVDLGTIDVLRDRERGIPRYNELRRLLRMPTIKSFEDLTSNPEWAANLRRIYDNDVERLDLMIGMFAEELPEGFGFSDTAFRIFILMASRRLKSDRFFTDDYTPAMYSQAGFDWIQENDMASVLKRHFPEVAPALQGVENPFKPWRKL